ncbi:hypothetical protein [Bradyrhizobium japonicum]|uniref:hypothetical protein n=1 Tax=Bradyrhizobium japonicum TaxID=375 RepID=UPI0027151865|nr:hypothetical protein [Bradyrhizobium japonicum]WLB50428.1 hypothetical protein QIH94_23920 [Bradyrhizobium japonicum]WLB59299.1 hypothetical protein QIH96_22410 [Bradyrhizobium japonicum]
MQGRGEDPCPRWQVRREVVDPRDRGLTIARVMALTYGKSADDSGIRQFGIAWADAMALRDPRGEAITEIDWVGIENRLGEAYRSLNASGGR